MGIKRFLTSRVFVINFIIALGVTLLLIYMVLSSLKLYTRHGEVIPVPDLHGLTKFEYSALLDRTHLRYEIIDSVYVEHLAPGAVIDHIPDAGHLVKRNRSVLLTVNSVAPEEVVVPRLIDISLRQSLSQLENAGLLPGEVVYEPSEYKNLVLEAKLNNRTVKPGDRLPRGSKIDLVVGTGMDAGFIPLPRLIGLSLDLAQNIVTQSNLRLGLVIYDNTIISSSDSLYARVWRQNPDVERIDRVRQGSSVDVWISMDETKFIEQDTPEEEEFENFGF
jgi:beta-lactam-binding protein with PASTA domain